MLPRQPHLDGTMVSGTNGTYLRHEAHFFVIPAKAGIQCLNHF